MAKRDVSSRGSRVRPIRAGIAAAALALLALVVPVSQARADQTFHTERIPLMPVNGAPLQSGFVVDVHANGPTIYAIERYVLNGALPNTLYQVQTLAYANGSNCTGAPFIVLSDATFTTNVTGNGEAGSVINPALVDGLHGTTLQLVWQVLGPNGVAYQTHCVTVPLD